MCGCRSPRILQEVQCRVLLTAVNGEQIVVRLVTALGCVFFDEPLFEADLAWPMPDRLRLLHFGEAIFV